MLPWRQLPWSIPLMAGLLMVCGWLGIGRCEEIADAAAGAVRHQVLWSALAIAAMAVVAAPNYRAAGKWSYAALGISLLLLVVVYLFTPINGAHRWIRVGGIGFQPSEFAKLALVLALAHHLAYRDACRQFVGLIPPLVATMISVWLVLKE